MGNWMSRYSLQISRMVEHSNTRHMRQSDLDIIRMKRNLQDFDVGEHTATNIPESMIEFVLFDGSQTLKMTLEWWLT